MATKKDAASVLNKLAGKTVMFQGKFGYGEMERLKAMAEAQGGNVVEELDASVDFLVRADLTGGKTVQKKAQSLNGKGASVQAVDANAFENVVKPSAEQVMALIRGGAECAPLLSKALAANHMVLQSISLGGMTGMTMGPAAAGVKVEGEKFEGLDLAGFDLSGIIFERCSFAGCRLDKTKIGRAMDCDFTGCGGESARFEDVTGSSFRRAELRNSKFTAYGKADFSEGILVGVEFSCGEFQHGARNKIVFPGCVFARSRLIRGLFRGVHLTEADFSGARMTGTIFIASEMEGTSFGGATLEKTSLIEAKLKDSDFSGSTLRDVNLAWADLTGAVFRDAQMDGCNLHGAMHTGVDFGAARRVEREIIYSGGLGDALRELDQVGSKAQRISVSFSLAGDGDEKGDVISTGTYGIVVNNQSTRLYYSPRHGGGNISDGLLNVAGTFCHRKVRFETLEVSSNKSPKGGKELRELVMKGIEEAFGQARPAEAELAAATKAWREKTREKETVSKEEREKAMKAAAKAKVAETKKVEKQIARAVGKVTDVGTFLRALELRIEKPKIDKATKMLKASGFKLFNDVAETHLNGVVKSQTDPDLVYACRIESDGNYACCTQNLNICGGLRGSMCKHLLVLIIGLVQAGELDPTTVDGWVAKSRDMKAELDKEKMGEIFIRYKGAEAGEVDWRPTETVPEDYYTL
jgi:uncharacterized protein YjbI with pentapeptide repeats